MGTVRRALALASSLLAGACGGQPVGSKVPRPDPSAVAITAAAAATALTLANPNAKAPVPEVDSGRALEGPSGPKETVPAGVLDRADARAGAAVEPCKEPAPAPPAGAPAPRVDLFPGPLADRGRVQPPPPPAPPPCPPPVPAPPAPAEAGPDRPEAPGS